MQRCQVTDSASGHEGSSLISSRLITYDDAPTYGEFLDRAAISGPHAALIGTPASVAADMEQWLESRACDGFTLLGGDPVALLDQTLLPELRRRGSFRSQYTGTTLRDHLGLPLPA